jgi:hypothetical protein
MDWKEVLRCDDEFYMEQNSNGDSVMIDFTGLPVSEKFSRTILLKSKGYYLVENKRKGKPAIDRLKRFRQEGELSRFSKNLFDTYVFQIARTE